MRPEVDLPGAGLLPEEKLTSHVSSATFFSGKVSGRKKYIKKNDNRAMNAVTILGKR